MRALPSAPTPACPISPGSGGATWPCPLKKSRTWCSIRSARSRPSPPPKACVCSTSSLTARSTTWRSRIAAWRTPSRTRSGVRRGARPVRASWKRAGGGWPCRGLRVAREGFADRAYEADGSLTPRTRPGAVIHAPADVIGRAVRMARDGVVRATNGTDIPMRVDTICTHGDTPASHELTRQLRAGSGSRGHRGRALHARPRGHDRGTGVRPVDRSDPSRLFGWWHEGTTRAGGR